MKATLTESSASVVAATIVDDVRCKHLVKKEEAETNAADRVEFKKVGCEVRNPGSAIAPTPFFGLLRARTAILTT